MSDFFQHLIERHSRPADNIRPRLPGRFEPERFSPAGFSGNDGGQAINPGSPDPDNQLDSPAIRKSEDFNSEKLPFRQNPFSNSPIGNTISKKASFNSTSSDPAQMRNEKLQISKSPLFGLKHDDLNGITREPDKPITSDLLTKRNNSIEVKPVIQDKSPIPSFSTDRPERRETQPQKPTIKPVVAGEELRKIKSPDAKKSTPDKMGLFALPERFNKWMDEPVKEAGSPESKAEPLPPIQVNIGRIEVKAITETSPAPLPRKTSYSPKLSLEDYLKQRNGGKR